MKKKMTPEEPFKIAHRFYSNAKEFLKRAAVEYNRYQDPKPVHEATGMGYIAVLKALDGFLLSRGVPPDKLPTSVIEYNKALTKYSQRDGKLLAAFHTVYENLHIFGYYKGGKDVQMIKSGFEAARFIIEHLTHQKLSS